MADGVMALAGVLIAPRMEHHGTPRLPQNLEMVHVYGKGEAADCALSGKSGWRTAAASGLLP